MMKNTFKPGNSCAQVRKKYKAEALRLHPNKGGSKEAFQQLHALYEAALLTCLDDALNAATKKNVPIARKQPTKKYASVFRQFARPSSAPPLRRPAQLFSAGRKAKLANAPPAPPPSQFVLFGSRTGRSAGPRR